MTLEALYNDFREKAGNACVAMNDGATQKSIKNLKKLATDAGQAYNAEVARLQYVAWATAGSPMETAIRERHVEHGKKVAFKQTDSGRYFTEFSDCKIKVDLTAFQKAVGPERFNAPNWNVKIQKLAVLLANALNEKLSKNPDFRYEVDLAADEFNFSDLADTTSDASLLKALQQTYDAILFIPARKKDGTEVNKIKAIKPAWECIVQSMTRQGAGYGEVAIAGTDKMAELVADTMHCILTNKPFKLVKS